MVRTYFRYVLSLTTLLPSLLLAQTTQVIKGTVKDMDSEELLIGASIAVLDLEPKITAATDADGRFRMEAVPIGRHAIAFTYVGYKTVTLPNVLVTAGKEVVLEVALESSVAQLNAAVVVGNHRKDKPQNELAKVSARTFSLEEVTRYSGGRNDVARLATNFAGVNSANDSRNDIVVRGNSPTGLLWRVDGLPIGTTNHFATLGTTGGPVSALNTNLLRTSDFMTSAFPAEYGNANAAVFDVKFRNGNADKHEFTGQVSAFTGIELVAEGPIDQEDQSSYLISYRYGLASLATTGTSAKPYFQDLGVKLNLGKTKLGRFEFFGMGGLSSIDFLGAEIDSTDLFSDPEVDAFVENQLALAGMGHFVQLDAKSYLKTTVGTTYTSNRYDQDNILLATNETPERKYRAVEVYDREQRYTFSSQYNRKTSPRFHLRAGVVNEVIHLNSHASDRDGRVDIPDNNNDSVPDYFYTARDMDEYTNLLQVYAQGEYKFTDDLEFTLGLHAQHLALTADAMVGPRAAISWQFMPNQRLSLAYGLHGQMVPLPILVRLAPNSNGDTVRTNGDLSFMKSHHLVLAYDRRFGENWRVKAEGYYQALFALPVEAFASSYSAVNEGADFVFTERNTLVSEGTGSNSGVELTLEKFLTKGFYTLGTASIFRSRYAGSDGVERSTSFNNGYVLNALLGKELAMGKAKRNYLTFDTKFTTSGGRPFTPIDLEATRANGGRQVLQEQNAFRDRYPQYLRLDVKVGFRLNSGKKKMSHQFFVDLQNITNRQNVFLERYNPVTDRINTVYQNGFFPDFLYRIQF
jgi:Carboxypeptidase regulatory-like domain/TonB-dependent Receptor Plug Domain